MQCGSRRGFPTPVNKSATSGHRGCPFLALSRRRSRANGCLSGHSLDVLLFALMRTFVRRFVIRFDVDQSFLLLIASPLQRNHARSTTPRPNGDICVSVGDCRKMPSAPTLGCVPPEWLGDHAHRVRTFGDDPAAVTTSKCRVVFPGTRRHTQKYVPATLPQMPNNRSAARASLGAARSGLRCLGVCAV
jgi:hypothetical protein